MASVISVAARRATPFVFDYVRWRRATALRFTAGLPVGWVAGEVYGQAVKWWSCGLGS